MILSDKDIRVRLDNHSIVIKPLPDLAEQLGSCSLDLRLGDTYRVFNHSTTPFIDPRDPKTFENTTMEITVSKGDSFTLHPGEFILAQTAEYIEMPDDLAGSLEGRSSIGRLGIIVHSAAATVDPGFCGNITLELANMGRIPVVLYPGMRICSLSSSQLSSTCEVPYSKKKHAKYAGQTKPLTSKIGEENNHG